MNPSPTHVVDLSIAEAIGRVVVDQTHGLHEGVARRRTHELEAAALQILAHESRLRRLRGYLREATPAVLDRLPANEAPEVRVQRAHLFSKPERRPCVCNGRLDLRAVADDT